MDTTTQANTDNNDPLMSPPIIVEIGSGQPVTIDKLYGPTIFANLRITADSDRGWVIERQSIGTGDYVEWCTIPAQLDQLDSCAERDKESTA